MIEYIKLHEINQRRCRMEQQISISESEWQVMKIVWNNSPQTLPEILDRLKGTDWSKTTIQTYLARLVKKGALSTKRQGKGYLYYPAVSECDCQHIKQNSRSQAIPQTITRCKSKSSREEISSPLACSALRRISGILPLHGPAHKKIAGKPVLKTFPLFVTQHAQSIQ